jgi:hypothetical protein
MHRRLLIVLVAGSLIAADGPQVESDGAKLLETLVALEKKSFEMVKQRDIAGLQNYATDNFLWIFADGTRVQKKDLEKFVSNFELVSYSLSGADVIQLNADAAVLVYRLTQVGGDKGKAPVKQTVWSTSTYVRRAGEWKAILYQETALKD